MQETKNLKDSRRELERNKDSMRGINFNNFSLMSTKREDNCFHKTKQNVLKKEKADNNELMEIKNMRAKMRNWAEAVKGEVEAVFQKVKQKEKEMDYRREMIRNLKYQFRKSTTQIAVT